MQNQIRSIKKSDDAAIQIMITRFKGFRALYNESDFKNMTIGGPAITMYRSSYDENDIFGFFFPKFYAHPVVLFFHGSKQLQELVHNDRADFGAPTAIYGTFSKPVILELGEGLESETNLVKDVLRREKIDFLLVNSDSRRTVSFADDRAPKGVSLKDMVYGLSVLRGDEDFRWLNQNAPAYLKTLTEAWEQCVDGGFVAPLVKKLVEEIDARILIERACKEVEREGQG